MMIGKLLVCCCIFYSKTMTTTFLTLRFVVSSGVDDEADPIGALYVELEEQNHKACKFLIEKGYSLATKLKGELRKGR